VRPPDRPAGPATADDIEDADPGLAAERTRLAWTRAAISFTAVGGALLKAAPLAGVLVLGMSALVWGLGRLAARGAEPVPAGRRHRMLLLITAAVAVVSSVALALVLLSGPGELLR
jgi:uncharacterized membrane protein YidH (DUF202 family)